MSDLRLRADLPAVICLMGPTAMGKSALAVYLAQHLNCEIISVDSMLVFRGMDIGTAKPNHQQQGGIPHHMIDILDPAQVFSTGQFREQAMVLIEQIIDRGKVPLLVGGTMLYFKGLFDGLAQLPAANPQLRAALEEQATQIGWQAMHRELAAVDPESAQRIHPNDPQRIQRALEVYKISGETLSVLMQRSTDSLPAFDFIKLTVIPEHRRCLHETIRSRFMDMLEQGLIQETRTFFERNDMSAKLPSMRAVGYRQVWAYLDQQLDYLSMVEHSIIATRQLAKRQLTWLRSIETTKQYIIDEQMPYSQILADVHKAF